MNPLRGCRRSTGTLIIKKPPSNSPGAAQRDCTKAGTSPGSKSGTATITAPSAIPLPCPAPPQPSPEPRPLSCNINSATFNYQRFNNFVLHFIWGPEQAPPQLPSRCHRPSSLPQPSLFARTGRTDPELDPAKTFFPRILRPLLPLSAVTLASRQPQPLQPQAPS